MTIPTNSAIGDIWLRARVVCSTSLGLYSDNMNLIATGYQHQGEVEDYKLTVVARAPAAPVPEPATLFIFALGLLSLAANRKSTFNKF